MALIKCVECGKEYSDKASACPNCGNPSGSSNSSSRNNKNVGGIVAVILSLVIFGGLFYFFYTKIGSLFESSIDGSKYDTSTVYNVGDTLICPNFEITINDVQIKQKGTRIDSYSVIDDPEWIGVILTVKNTSNETKTFYGSDVDLVNTSGQVLSHSWLTYKIWGTELLNSPELVSGGSKKGYIQFSNTETNNSNLILKVDCNTGLFDDDIIYQVNVSK